VIPRACRVFASVHVCVHMCHGQKLHPPSTQHYNLSCSLCRRHRKMWKRHRNMLQCNGRANQHTSGPLAMHARYGKTRTSYIMSYMQHYNLTSYIMSYMSYMTLIIHTPSIIRILPYLEGQINSTNTLPYFSIHSPIYIPEVNGAMQCAHGTRYIEIYPYVRIYTNLYIPALRHPFPSVSGPKNLRCIKLRLFARRLQAHRKRRQTPTKKQFLKNRRTRRSADLKNRGFPRGFAAFFAHCLTQI